MPTETAQLLSTVWWLCEPKTAKRLNKKGTIYKKISNHNHGSAKWARESVGNYKYLIEMGLALCIEYTFRYGRRHKCQDMIEWFQRKRQPHGLHEGDLTPFYQAVPDECKHQDPVIAYKQLYVSDHKRHLAKWKKRSQPNWWRPMRNEYKKSKKRKRNEEQSESSGNKKFSN
jgi:hypothetical protein